MTPEQLQNIYNVLAQNVSNEAAKVSSGIDAAAAAKGPSLGRTGVAAPNGASNLAGSYNYNRLFSPTVNQLRDSLVLAGQQYAFKQAVNDAMRAAQDSYTKAQRSYQKRAYARASALTGGTSGNTTPTGVSTVINGVDINPRSGTATAPTSPATMQQIQGGNVLDISNPNTSNGVSLWDPNSGLFSTSNIGNIQFLGGPGGLSNG